MNDLSTRVRNYLDRKKPRRQVNMTPDVKTEVEPEVIYVTKPANPTVKIIKLIVGVIGMIMVVWAMSVVEMQNRCYLDRICREEMERVNR